ncbi:septal ring lytic transglycosylase RlpA family protein [Silvibacterium acidisoli]|uniref:septal ring lytic transglycosylase RlpA family protein n=1 Tax=Acidobacteriaceae bacterium ZG23-2 TaxID=2883246 RepID=UPI00406C4795
MSAIAIPKRSRLKRSAAIAGSLLAAALTVSGPTTGHAEQPTSSKAPAHHWYQIGRASWYGKFFQGRTTADGESYDMNELTCAHRSLPMGSLVRVTNLSNQKSVVVRVNDRGPMPRSRVIDLSYAAARFLGFSGKGTASVKLELLKDDPALAMLKFPLDPSAFRLTPTLVR